VGNLILLILNLPLIPLWITILKIPQTILTVGVLGFCVIGAYSTNYNVLDIGVMLFFGLVGYAFKKVDIPLAPMVLTLVLGPLMERALRQSMEMSGGRFGIMFERPISAVLVTIAILVLLVSSLALLNSVKEDSET
jgi:putative tricarboxylic transport membrane protein